MASEIRSNRFQELLADLAKEHDRLLEEHARVKGELLAKSKERACVEGEFRAEHQRCLAVTDAQVPADTGELFDAEDVPAHMRLGRQTTPESCNTIDSADPRESTNTHDSAILPNSKKSQRGTPTLDSGDLAELDPPKSHKSTQQLLRARDSKKEFFTTARDDQSCTTARDEFFMRQAMNIYHHDATQAALELLDLDGHGSVRKFCTMLVASRYFEWLMGCLITLNSVVIGLETEYEGDWPTLFRVVDSLFLVVYILELAAKFFAIRLPHQDPLYRDGWIRFDILVVVAGALHAWLLVPLGADKHGSMLSNIMAIRMLRLFRIARALRMLQQFRSLWTLVRGVTGCMPKVVNACLLTFLFLYMFSILCFEAIAKNEDKHNNEVMARFCDIPTIMLTLISFVNADSISSIYEPLIIEDWTLIFYFIPIIFIVTIALMNVITAAIVEEALEQSKAHDEFLDWWREQEMQQTHPRLAEIFSELRGEEGSDTLKVEAFQRAPQEFQLELKEYTRIASMTAIFDMLDEDGSGEVDCTEFIEGITNAIHVSNSTQGTQSRQILHLLRVLARKNMKHVPKLKGLLHTQQQILQAVTHLSDLLTLGIDHESPYTDV